MANKLFKKLESFNNKPKSGFDLSQRRQFTSPMGMLLPVWCDFANPGDGYTLNSECFIRTEPVETAAFERMKHHVDFFFVPITSLYQFWPEFFFGTNDINTNFVPDASKIDLSAVPNFDFMSVIRFETYQSTMDNWFVSDQDEVGDRYAYAKTDEFGIPYVWHLRRLLDLFGYGSIDTIYGIHVPSTKLNLNLFKYLAYHKIFYSHYINSNFYPNDPDMYNVDAYVTSVNNPTGLSPLVGKIMSTIHYRPYRRDYFTNIFPTPQFSSGWANALTQNPLLVGGNENVSLSDISPDSQGLFFGDNNYFDNNPEYGLQLLTSADDRPAITTANNIRTLMAYDRLLRITGMAGNHYHEQLKAHFGVSMPQGVKNEAYFLGSNDTDIVINEIVATASSEGADGSVLGQLAGKGTAVSSFGHDIKFTAPCHGIIMAISSIEPYVDYASMGLERENRYRTTFDFYHPEFDDLGMQPFYDVFFNTSNFGGNAASIHGWQYRYSEAKTKFDVVNEGFWNTGRKSWVGFKQNLYNPNYLSPQLSPTFFDLFYVAPQYTNTIFALQVPYFVAPGSKSDNTVLKYQYEGNSPSDPSRAVPRQWDAQMQDPSDPENMIDIFKAPYVYGSDNFLINLNIGCYKTSIMSVHSLPNFKF